MELELRTKEYGESSRSARKKRFVTEKRNAFKQCFLELIGNPK